MKRFYCSIFFLLFGPILNAQSLTADIFNKASDRLQSLKSVSYKVRSTERNPFGSSDVIIAATTAEIVFDSNSKIVYKKEETNINDGRSAFREIFVSDKVYSVNLTDSTYTEKVPKSPISCEMTDIAIMMKSDLKEHASKIIHQTDTAFDGKTCYNFLIKIYDTIANGNHDYTHRQILIDRKTMFPVYLKITGVGTASKEGFSLGRLNIYTEKTFYGFAVNKKIHITQFVNSGFSQQNTEMLKDGEKAPELSLKSLSGVHIPEGNFKDKLLLVVFGETTCPANPLANPMLNRLHSKFSSPEFSIINIYTNETTEQVKKYIKGNSLRFPVYLGNRKLNRAFKTLGTPDFYLISRDGKVIRTSNGYSKYLEEDLNREIGKLLDKTL